MTRRRAGLFILGWLLLPWFAPRVNAAEAAILAETAAPQWVAKVGRPAVVQWQGAESLPITPAGKAVAVLTTATVGGRNLVLALWPESANKQGAWLGERLEPSAGKPRRIVSLWQGVVGAQDADGERSIRLQLSATGLLRYQQVAGVRHCDGQPSKLFPQQFDLQRKQFVAAPNLPVPNDLPQLQAHTTAPPLPGAMTWPAEARAGFRFTTASAPATTAGDLSTLLPPFALTETGGTWVLPAEQAKGAFATARAPLPTPVIGVELFAPPPDQAEWPVRLRVTLGPSMDFVVALPEAAHAQRVWLALPTPMETSCLSVQVLEPRSALTPTGLAQIRTFSALDGPQGANVLADRLAGGNHCDSNLKLLTAQAAPPEAVAQALLDRLASAQANGQFCLLRALSTLPVPSVPAAHGWLPEALPALLQALAFAPAEPRRQPQLPQLTSWLGRAGEAAALALGGIAVDDKTPEQVRTLAARLLAQQDAEPVFQNTLLTLLLGETHADTNVLHGAVASARGTWIPRLAAAFLATNPNQASTRAALLLGLLKLRLQIEGPGESSDVWQRVQELAGEQAQDFTVRARAMSVLGELGSPTAQAILVQLAANEPDPVLRYLAVEALGPSLQTPGAPLPVQAALSRALGDRDPRVRQTACRAWAQAPQQLAQQHLAALVQAFEQERWPFVIAAHVGALGRTCSAEAQLLATLEKTDLPVDAHVVALEQLTACKLPAAREQALRQLKRQNAPLPARLAAAQTLAVTATPKDTEVLLRTLEHVVNTAAADPALDELAVAVLQTLTPLDSARAVKGATAVLKLARARPRQAAFVTLGSVCGDEARQQLHSQSESQDATLAAAAQRALRECESRGP